MSFGVFKRSECCSSRKKSQPANSNNYSSTSSRPGDGATEGQVGCRWCISPAAMTRRNWSIAQEDCRAQGGKSRQEIKCGLCTLKVNGFSSSSLSSSGRRKKIGTLAVRLQSCWSNTLAAGGRRWDVASTCVGDSRGLALSRPRNIDGNYAC